MNKKSPFIKKKALLRIVEFAFLMIKRAIALKIRKIKIVLELKYQV